jgi:PAS domain-containing protein
MLSDDSEHPDRVADNSQALRAVLETATDGVLLTNSERSVTARNDRFLEIWKMPETELAARDFQKILGHISKEVADARRYLARITEIEAAKEKTCDLLEVGDKT